MHAAVDIHRGAPAVAAQVDVSVTTELLVPFFRVSRSPLATWTKSLIERLAEAQARPEEDWYASCDRIASCFNEAALVEVHFGRPAHALALCHREIEWAQRASAHPGRLAAAQFAFQPYINIGRLERNSGRWDDAIARFRRLRDFLDGASVELGPLVVTGEHATAIAEINPEFAEQMNANYLVDTLITLLGAQRFAQVERFVAAAGCVRLRWLSDLMYEAVVIALCSLGDPVAALQRVDDYLRRPHRPHSGVFLYRRAELLLAVGDPAGAGAIARRLAIAHLASSAVSHKINLRLLVRLARLLTAIGDERAPALTRVALARAEQADDVLFQQELCMLLASNAATAQERLDANTRAETVRRLNSYGAARAGATAVPANAVREAIDRLYEQLTACAEGV